MPTTTHYALPYPTEGQIADVPADMGALANAADAALFALAGSTVLHGLASARPAASAPRLYLATDTHVLSLDDGAAWHDLATLDVADTFGQPVTLDAGAVFADEGTPAAPGSGKVALYAKAGVLYVRAGAAGAETPVGASPWQDPALLDLL